MHKASIKFAVNRVHEPEQRQICEGELPYARQKKTGWQDIPPARLVSSFLRSASGSVTRVGLARRHGPRLRGEGADARRADAAIAFAMHRRHHAAVGVGDDMPRGRSQYRGGEGWIQRDGGAVRLPGTRDTRVVTMALSAGQRIIATEPGPCGERVS